MTSPQPSSIAIPETPPGNTNHQPPPIASSPIQEEKEESSSAATHNARALISKDSSKTKSTAAAEDSWHPLPCSPHRQREIAMNNSTHTMDPCLASPTNGWPQRSPMKSDHDQDAASFTLFTQSFDTLSETGHFLRHAASSSTSIEQQHPDEPPRKIDVTAREDASSWVGDISPIKLGVEDNYHAARSENHHHYDAHPPQPQIHYEEPHHGDGYSSYGHAVAPRSNPFFVLRSAHRVFVGCSYLLPCLENREICPISIGAHSSIRLCRDERTIPGARDVVIARRRVETAIHAFGGFIKPKHVMSKHDSIFRLKASGYPKSPWKQFYDDCFHRRYVVSANHVSWEVEQNPPVHEENISNRRARRTADLNDDSSDSGIDRNEHGSPHSTVSMATAENQQQKMKYRCKLCGQLKQNHNCPYQQSLQRSIGVMVYPAVNAYTASEPGVLAPALSKMNNFVSYDSSNNNTSDWLPQPHVTPETKSRDIHSSQSSLSSTESIDPATNSNMPSFNGYPRQLPTQVAAGRKRTNQQMHQEGYIKPRKRHFVKTLALRQEHYRAVTPRSNDKKDSSEFMYPHVTLTFRERKRLSDTLFFLSKEIPNMTIPVASLLRAARDKDEWDLSVAELLTQIVVGLYCREGDHRLDGLQDYLLRLGVSC